MQIDREKLLILRREHDRRGGQEVPGERVRHEHGRLEDHDSDDAEERGRQRAEALAQEGQREDHHGERRGDDDERGGHGAQRGHHAADQQAVHHQVGRAQAEHAHCTRSHTETESA